MQHERRNQIVKKNPYLYGESFYFECEDGWLDIIEDLSDKLERLIIDRYLQMEKFGEDIEYQRSYASQVKEKYGGLRFYMYGSTQEMEKLIDDAEKKSKKTCEICGKLGFTRYEGWITTLCDSCYQNTLNTRKIHD